jgi:hypothetical protein
MRLWSEFAAYPWVVLAVIWTIKSWRALDDVADDRRGMLRIAGHGLMVALMFLLIMSVKAVAEGILLFYLWPFYWRIFSSWRQKNSIKARQALIFCLVVLAVFEGLVCTYKWCNYQQNGHFAFTNRGDWILYGCTARRMQPLTARSLGASVAFVPGMGLCTSLFKVPECDYWSATHSDDLMAQKKAELSTQGLSDQQTSKYFINQSIKMILANPLQAIVLMTIEAHKMFFWESSIAFVAYPDWLEGIFYSIKFSNDLKIMMALLSWGACVFAFYYLCFYSRRAGTQKKSEDDVLFWILNFIFWYMAMYSLFFILDRYAFPLVSFFMVLIAFLLDKITRLRIR